MQLSITVGVDKGQVVMNIGGEMAVTASTHNGTVWQPLPQLLSPNATLQLISTAVKFRASVPDCNRALATLEYRSVDPLSLSIEEIARVTIIVNDMGNYGCYNDCSTAAPVPLLAVSTIVIVNYGWFRHRWLLLRPGVLLGVVTGMGMLLIIMASICAWLYLVNRLLPAKGKAKENQQKLSCMPAVKTRWEHFLVWFSKTEDFDPQEPIVPSLGVASGDMLDDDGPWTHNAVETADDGYTQNEVLAERDSVVMYQTVDSFAREECPGGVVEDFYVDNYVNNASATNGASDVKDGGRDYEPIDCPVGVARQCSNFSQDKGPANDTVQAVYTPDSGGSSLAENNYPASDAIQADYVADSSGHSNSNTDKDAEDDCPASDAIQAIFEAESSDHFHSNTDEGALEGIGYHCSDGFTLPGDLEAAELQISTTAERSHNEYSDQIDKEVGGIDDVLRSMPFGDSSGSSDSHKSTEEGNADLGRLMSIEPVIDMYGNLEEDRICQHNGNGTHPPINSHPADPYEEVMPQMPELKLILELPEGSSLDEDIDPLDHINLVLSSLEKDADGSLVAVLSRSR